MWNLPNDDGFSIESHCIAKCIIESCFYNMFYVFARIDECDTATDVSLLQLSGLPRHGLQLKKLQSANVFESWYTGLYFECDLDDKTHS